MRVNSKSAKNLISRARIKEEREKKYPSSGPSGMPESVKKPIKANEKSSQHFPPECCWGDEIMLCERPIKMLIKFTLSSASHALESIMFSSREGRSDVFDLKSALSAWLKRFDTDLDDVDWLFFTVVDIRDHATWPLPPAVVPRRRPNRRTRRGD